MSKPTKESQCPQSIEDLDEIVEECYACGEMNSNNLCKEHTEMLKELQEVSRSY